MSDAEQALTLLKEQKVDFDQLKKSVDELKTADNAGQIAEVKEKQANIEAAMTKADVEMEKLVKSIEVGKAITQEMAGIDKDVQKRAECIELIKGLRDIANQNSHTNEINTAEFKSVKDLMERKDYNSFDDARGGAAVIPFIDSFLDKLAREHSDVRNLASVSTISTDKYEQLKMNQLNGAFWEKDMANFTAGTKNNTLSKLNIIVQNLHGIAIFSDDLINDNAFNLVGEVLTSLAEDFAIAEGQSFYNGDGVGEMSGIIQAVDSANTFDGIERISTVASNVIALEDIYNLIGALIAPYEQGAQFKAHRLTITELRKLRSDSGAGPGTGDFLWQPSNIVGVPATLAGFPISQAVELSSTPLVDNAESIVFGNFKKAYKIVDRMGMSVMRDQYTAYPNVAYKAKKRVGGGVSKGAALKILKTTA